MSLIEKGVYIELLADQWCNGPFSLEMAFRVCPEAERGVVECVVRSKFVQGDDGNWLNNRLEQERISQEERRKVQVENGKKGGRPKANENPKETHGFLLGLQNGKPKESQTESQGKAKKNPSDSVSDSVSDITHTHSQPNRDSISVPDELSVCWSRWSSYSELIGKPINAIQAQVVLMDLGRRGADKAARDIDFSIRKSAKSILDSDNDFEKQAAKPRTFTPATKTRNYT